MKFWGTSKQSAYIGWFLTLIGGAGISAGGVLILVTRIITERFRALNPNLTINPEAYANVQLMGAVLIFIGLFGCIFGIVAIHNSQKTVMAQP